MDDTSSPGHLYRNTSLGTTLLDSLDEMVMDGRMTPKFACKIVENFDIAMISVLRSKVKARLDLKGKLEDYRCINDEWYMVLKDVVVTLDGRGAAREKIVLDNLDVRMVKDAKR
ncbi:hypothetical protein FN846DRAFT_958722 [Sphaerosporella brunnea]|uniref:Transcription initiation factor IIA subunit 2 n=1 Tax=Sphaerosporella brunnea TaxID=1250544 RepID=A0A5J5EQC7_9PEZI|nr:hypothetical protein FN846DRAFT_958722 [Sphaerosporella brunnea]